MRTRYFALVYGIVFLLVGIAGFIPGLVTYHEPAADVAATGEAGTAMHGLLLGLFPVNALHNIVHIVFGAWGLAAYRSFTGARTYARVVAIVYAVLAVMGLIPGLDTTFGLIPLYGHDIWLHIVLAAVAAYFGFFNRADYDHVAGTTTSRI
ncbi:MAG TPA: DUF4383 domain-containing protein [Geminicoccus sp.]|uniref:DUF4383 domain-containing protein n=1 Tax=Geminicoccus sp. TaxID=2024832 RepID=UPI002E37F4A5|nr:DUF4383 domain-containing protein [Geminicoccus sp.]HEX2525304.1 DUF4383 domain-containing protein [Geminicoccus sp.]